MPTAYHSEASRRPAWNETTPRQGKKPLRRLVGGVLLSPLAYQWNELHEFREKLDCGRSSGGTRKWRGSGAKVIPHAGFLVPSPTNTLLASGGRIASNVSASEVTVTYHASQLTIEYFLPHDRLAVQINGLTSPTQTVPRSNPKTGADPFLQRRRQPLRHEVKSPKVGPF
jgi:hypothetical protein